MDFAQSRRNEDTLSVPTIKSLGFIVSVNQKKNYPWQSCCFLDQHKMAKL